MKKGFVLACLIAFVVQYEDFNHFIVMLAVGDFEISEAWSQAFKNSSIESALLIGCLRLIPFVFLILVTICTNLSTHYKGQITLSVGFIVTNIVVFLGYWGVTESLYTDAHTSSTSAIGYMWAPITALVYATLACTVMYFLLWLFEVILKRA